jgi:hypothetical protein
MTRTEFNHLLSQIKALPPEQMRQLRQQIDSELADPRQQPGRTSGKATKRSTPGQTPEKTSPIEELHRKMMTRGLIRRLPDPSLDIDDDGPDDQPVPIEGEPLSETILRERR